MRFKEYKDGGKTSGDKKVYAYNYYLKKGVPAIQAAGIVGNLAAESAFNTTVVGKADSKGSQGIAQWHSERLNGLKKFAGNNWTNLDSQLDYVLYELNTTEKKAKNSLFAAKTPQEAALAFMNDYEKPAEWAKKQSGSKRINESLKLLGLKPDPDYSYGSEEENNPYRFSEYKKTDYYAPQVSENISSLDNTQENTNLAEDKATEIKNRLEQKKAEKALLQQMILATQVAYVNPADYQSQPTFEEPEEEQMFQRGGIQQFKKQPFKLKDERGAIATDNTKVNNYNNARLFNQNVRNKTDKEIAQEREAKIQASVEAQKTPYTKENWRQQLAAETSATGDKLRVSLEPNFFDDYLNPAVMIGSMASNLGQAPLQAEQSDSVLPYITSVGAPLVTGALAGLGTQTSGQFVNNLANPLAGTGIILKNVKNQASLVKDLIFDKNITLNKNFVFDSKNKIYNQIEEGYTTLDKSLAQKINDLESEEGKRRLINQEKEYLQDFYYDPKSVDLEKVATENADARIEELENIKAFGNKNKEFVYNVDKDKVGKSGIIKPNIETVQYRYGIPTNNANYQYNDAIIDNPSGSKMIPGKLTLGRGYENSTPTAFHEINHALQRNRTLKIDDELKNIVPDFKKNLSYDDVNAYTYFKSGSEGQESSSFLAELREQMKKDGFIKDTYDEITPDLIEKVKDYYTKNKTKKVFVNKGGLQGITNTRILDFSRPTLENYKIISDAMNKLPALAPIAGASYLATQEQPQYQQGGTAEVDNKWLQDWYKNRVIPNNDIQGLYLEDKPIYMERLNNIPSVTKVDMIDKNPNVTGQYQGNTGKILITPTAQSSVYTHEANHYLNDFTSTMRTVHDNVVEQNMYKKGDSRLGSNNENYEYFRNPDEIHSRVQVMRKDAGFKPNEEVIQEKLLNYLKDYKGNDENILQLMNLTDEKGLLEMLNYMAYNSESTKSNIMYAKNGGEKNSLWKNIRANRGSGRKPTKEMLEQERKIKRKEDGGVIEDDRGQWVFPGEITKINSGNITMEGVNYPVYGVDNLGNSQMMYPGQNYQFPGTSVIEYPQIKSRIKTNRFSK